MSDYKKSLNLPDTSFPMKANLTQREPEMLRWWEENNIYGTMLEASGSRGSFRLHDGPPYANGHLHLGHALNKIDRQHQRNAYQGTGTELVFAFQAVGWLNFFGQPAAVKNALPFMGKP